jgi:hypothetical protein
MGKFISKSEIKRLKREAKALSREQGIPHHEALKRLAQRKGLANWELLMRNGPLDNSAAIEPNHSSANGDSAQSSTTPATPAQVQSGCKAFIESLDEYQIFALCVGGSIWINLQDYVDGTVDADSFHRLGAARDNATQRAGYELGARLLIDFDGMADSFVFPDDEDCDGNPAVPDDWQVMYSSAAGRKVLLECLGYDFEWHMDGLLDALADEESSREKEEWSNETS